MKSVSVLVPVFLCLSNPVRLFRDDGLWEMLWDTHLDLFLLRHSKYAPLHRVKMGADEYFNMVGENRENGTILPNRNTGGAAKSRPVTGKIESVLLRLWDMTFHGFDLYEAGHARLGFSCL